jgi:ATP-dependent Lon protease
MPESVRNVLGDELKKLQELEPVASEANARTNYLDWLI